MNNAYRYFGPVVIFILLSCAHVGDSVQPLSRVSSDDSIRLLNSLPKFETGPSPYDCGPESAAYALRYFGRKINLDELSDELVRPEKKGTAIEVLLAYFKYNQGWEKLNARLLNQNKEVLRQVIDHRLMPIVMVDVGRFPADTFRAAEPLYAGQFHFYPVVGYGPKGIVVAEEKGLTHIKWDLFERMWSKAGGRWLVVWDETSDDVMQGTSSVRRRYNQAVSLIEQESYDQALEKLKKLVNENPLFARSYASIGYIRFQRQQYKEAETYYRKALARDPGLIRVQNNLAHALVKQGGQLEEAEERVNAVIRQASRKWGAQWNKKQVRSSVDRNQKDGEQNKHSSLLARAYHTRGMIHERREDWDAARADYHEGLRFSSSDQIELQYRIFRGLGQVQSQLNRWVEARNSYLQALQRARNKRQRRAVKKKVKELKSSRERRVQKKIGDGE